MDTKLLFEIYNRLQEKGWNLKGAGSVKTASINYELKDGRRLSAFYVVDPLIGPSIRLYAIFKTNLFKVVSYPESRWSYGLANSIYNDGDLLLNSIYNDGDLLLKGMDGGLCVLDDCDPVVHGM